jgi:O-antigen/teichoic acid export membrane protein
MENERNVIASNIVVQIVGQLFVLILSLVTIKIISNYLGPSGTGYYNTIITYLSFFITIADFGLFSVAVREMSKTPERREKFLSNILTIRFVSATIVTALAVILVQLTHYAQDLRLGVIIASGFLFFNLVGSIYDMTFQTKLQMKFVAYAQFLAKVIAVAAVFLISFWNLGFYYVILTVTLAAVLTMFFKWIFAVRNGDKISFGYDPALIKEILVMSLPLGAVFIVNNFYFKLDTLILFYYKGASQVGIYAVAYRVLETTMFAASFLAYSLKPLLSTNVNDDKQKAANAVSRGFTFLLAMSLLIGIACIPFSRQIIVFLSDKDFIGGAPVLIILSFASIVIYFNTLLAEVIIAKDHRRYLFFMMASVLLFNFITNVIFIPRYSYIAAASTTLASETYLFALGYSKAKKILPIHFDWPRVLKLLLSAALAIIAGMMLRTTSLYFAVDIVIAFIIYGLLVYLFDAVPRDLVNDYLLSIKNRWTGPNYQ